MENIELKQQQLIYLLGKIPNWEIYFTQKQLEYIKSYLKYLNMNTVDEKLNLKSGTCKTKLLGNNTSNGVLGKLILIDKKLINMNYYDNLKKNKNHINDNNEYIQKIKHLFEIIVNYEEYDTNLNNYQKEVLYVFLKTRNLKQTANYFKISLNQLKNILIDDNNNTSIYDIISQNFDKNVINSWDNI